MKGRISILFRDRFLLYTLSLTVIFLITAIALIVLSFQSLPPLVPFFNSMPWGISRLYDSGIALAFPIVLLGIVLLNTVISISIYKSFVLLSRIVSFNSLLFCLLATLAYLQILFLIY